MTRYIVAVAYLPENEIHITTVQGKTALQALLKGIYVCLGKSYGESRNPEDFISNEFIQKLIGLETSDVLEYLVECDMLANVVEVSS